MDLFTINVHGYIQIIKMIDNVPHIIEENKKGIVWTPTIVTQERLKKAIKINIDQALYLLQDAFSQRNLTKKTL